MYEFWFLGLVGVGLGCGFVVTGSGVVADSVVASFVVGGSVTVVSSAFG